ncbi:calcium-binding protein [Phaeobacter sp. J2-8]|uniref:calcium-binding protein n=1 Tax=Phaeobacter sp. J2-8 TaxID=2931394 RepID=UPI001FD4230C|nr:calcium-binding protein [Phaeobacter sp. J2-8]MCJ7873331.1 hypothetical protein [Phaeobacter sp. J2-8]
MATVNGDGNGNWLDGTIAPDIISGFGGDDWIEGWQGGDSISGGAGADYIRGNDGPDVIWGGEAGLADGVNSTEGQPLYLPGTFNEIDGKDTIYGGSGRDYLGGNQNDDQIFGEEGDDTLIGGQQNDSLYGGEGDDILFGDSLLATGETLLDDNDAIDLLHGGTGDDTLIGGPGNDLLQIEDFAEAVDDVFIGSEGQDTLESGFSPEFLNLNLGSETSYSYDGTTYTVPVSIEFLDMNGTAFSGTDDANFFDLRGLTEIIAPEKFWLEGGDDTFEGSDEGEDVSGGAGDDLLNGNGGDDTLNGSTGTDTINGGAGDDLLVLEEFAVDVNDVFLGGAGEDTLSGSFIPEFENLFLGATVTYLMDGVSTTSEVSIETLNMNDTRYSGTDNANFFDLRGLTEIIAPEKFWLEAGDDTFEGSDEGEDVSGGAGDDLLNGNGGDDTLNGSTGTDTINGGAGDDLLVLEEFAVDVNDVFLGGAGEDTLSGSFRPEFENYFLGRQLPI